MKNLAVNAPKDNELNLGEVHQPAPRLKQITNVMSGGKMDKTAFIQGYLFEKYSGIEDQRVNQPKVNFGFKPDPDSFVHHIKKLKEEFGGPPPMDSARRYNMDEQGEIPFMEMLENKRLPSYFRYEQPADDTMNLPGGNPLKRILTRGISGGSKR